MDTDSQIEVFESQIRELYGRVLWTHKTHEKCADLLLKRNSNIKIIQILLSAITTTGILVAVFGSDKCIGAITAFLSAVLFGLNTYTKDYDLGELGQKHTIAAVDLWNIREKYLTLLTDIKSRSLGIEELKDKRDLLQEELFNVYSGTPRTISKSYAQATKGLKENEELTFSDDEIDNLLPIKLRKN